MDLAIAALRMAAVAVALRVKHCDALTAKGRNTMVFLPFLCFYVLGVRLLLSWVRRIRFFSRNYNSVSFVLGNFRINQLDTAIVLLCLYESNMNGKKNRGDIHTSRNCD